MNKQTWKVSDIAGSSVIDERGVCIGVLEDVLPTGGNDVWVIKTDLNAAGEILLPALVSVVKEVDTAQKKIYVVLPKGLLEVFEESPQRPEE